MEVPLEDVETAVMLQLLDTCKQVIEASTSGTLRGLEEELWGADSPLFAKRFDCVRSGTACLRKLLHKHLRNSDTISASMDAIRKALVDRCSALRITYQNAPEIIVFDMLSFLRNTSKVIVHGCGMILADLIVRAVRYHPGITFYVTHGGSTENGKGRELLQLVSQNKERGHALQRCKIIPDASVAVMMSRVDMVVFGSHAVTEHGGLVNALGTLQISLLAKGMNVPVYVACETFKFSKIFPLDTSELKGNDPAKDKVTSDTYFLAPEVDFTPPSCVTLLFTEEGIIPPSEVADFVFRLHSAGEMKSILK